MVKMIIHSYYIELDALAASRGYMDFNNIGGEKVIDVGCES